METLIDPETITNIFFHREVLVEKWTPPNTITSRTAMQFWYKDGSGQLGRNNNLPAVIGKEIDIYWDGIDVKKVRLKDWKYLDFTGIQRYWNECKIKIYP